MGAKKHVITKIIMQNQMKQFDKDGDDAVSENVSCNENNSHKEDVDNYEELTGNENN